MPRARLLKTFLVVFALSLFLSSGIFATIKVGAWNIGSNSNDVNGFSNRTWGSAKGTDWTSVREAAAKVIAGRYDVIFLQEVASGSGGGCDSFGGDDSQSHICNLLTEVNSIAGAGVYEMDSSPNVSSFEKVSVMYKAGVVTVLDSFNWIDYDNSFKRVPHIVRLKVGADDFYVVTLHTTPSEARSQIWALPKVANQLEAGSGPGLPGGSKTADPDIMILGDYNADGSYFSPGVGGTGDWVTFFNNFNTPGYQNLILEHATTGDDTNLSPWSDYVYDRITVSPSLYTKYIAGSAKPFYYTGNAGNTCPNQEMAAVLDQGCNSGDPFIANSGNASTSNGCPYTAPGPATADQCYDAAKFVADHFPVEAQFTMGAPDVTPPNFVSGSPSGSFVPWDTTTIDLTFNEPMSPTSFSAGTVAINNGATVSFPPVTVANNIYRFTVSLPSSATTHTVTINGPTDLAGNSVNTPATYSFTTVQPPTVVIAEVGNGSAAADDYVLLYNPTSNPINLSMFYFGRDSGCTIAGGSTFSQFDQLPNEVISAQGYYLLGRTGNSLTNTPDNTSIDPIVTAGDCFAVTKTSTEPDAWNDSQVVDFVAFSGGTDQGEGNTQEASPATGNSIKRNGACKDSDTDVNSTDFVSETSPNPENSLSAACPADPSAPQIFSWETADLNSNGFIDAIKLTFTKNINDTTVDSADFTVTGYTVSGENTGTTANDKIYYITINELPSLGDTNATPAVNYSGATAIEDTLGNGMGGDSVSAALDGAPPVLLGASTDRSLNGSDIPSLTKLTLTFSEPIFSSATITTADFTTRPDGATVSGDLDGATINATASVSGNDITLDFTSATTGGSWTKDGEIDIDTITNTNAMHDQNGNAAVLNNGYLKIDGLEEKKLLIAEVGQDPNGNSNDDYILLYNPTESGVDIGGWSIGRDSGCNTGNGWTWFQSLPSVIVSPKKYYLIGRSDEVGLANDPDFTATPELSISSSGDCIVVTNDTTEPTNWNDANVIDWVSFSGAATSGEGNTTVSSNPSDDAYRRDGACKETDTDNNSADITTNVPTPNPENSSSAACPADPGAPAVVKWETQDLDSDGKLDAIKITFSEDIQDSTVVAADFDVAGYSGEAFSSTTNGDVADNNIIYITFNETGNSCNGTIQTGCDTGNTPIVSYVSSGAPGPIQDAASNQMANTSTTGAADQAPPVIIGATSDRSIFNGNMPAGTVLTLIFSETITGTAGDISVLDFETQPNGGTPSTNLDGSTSPSFAFSNGRLEITLSSPTTGNSWDQNAQVRIDGLVNANAIQDTVGHDVLFNTAFVPVLNIFNECQANPGEIVINDILVDGYTTTSPFEKDEYIEIYNTTSNTIDISGCYLDDRGDFDCGVDGLGAPVACSNTSPYKIPAGTNLAAHSTMLFSKETTTIGLNNNDNDSARFLKSTIENEGSDLVLDDYPYLPADVNQGSSFSLAWDGAPVSERTRWNGNDGSLTPTGDLTVSPQPSNGTAPTTGLPNAQVTFSGVPASCFLNENCGPVTISVQNNALGALATLTSYNDDINLAATVGNVTPSTITMVNGTWTGNLVFDATAGAGAPVTITARGVGPSNRYYSTTGQATLDINIRASIESNADQTFDLSQSPNPDAEIITIIEGGGNITAANDIRITIPNGLDLTWDTSVTTITFVGACGLNVGGTKINAGVTYENPGWGANKTAVLDVTSDFAANDCVDINGLKFVVGGASAPAGLELDVDGTADATTIDTDLYTKQVGSDLNFNLATSSASEAAGSHSITVSLPGNTPSNVDISFTVSGSAAGSGTDYTIEGSPVTITAGTSSTTIDITSIVDDSLSESDETVIITLTGATNANLGATTVHTFTITDNDGPLTAICPGTYSLDISPGGAKDDTSTTDDVGDISGNVFRGAIQCDPSALTLGGAGSTITKVELRAVVQSSDDQMLVPIHHMSNKPSTTGSGATLYTDAADGTLYTTSTNFQSNGSQFIDLGVTAASDYQAAWDASQDWFAAGLNYTLGGTDDVEYTSVAAANGNSPYFRITYLNPGVTPAPGPAMTAVVADDPDNGDGVYSNSDTIIITFSEPTNKPPVATKSNLDTLFTFSANMGTDYTGTWNSAGDILTITVVDSSGAAPPVLTTDTLTVNAAGNLRNLAGTSALSTDGPDAITGDWGIVVPSITSVVADDPDDGDTIYGNGDTITFIFDTDTNQPFGPSPTQANLDTMFGSLNLGTAYTGTWVSASELRIDITDATGGTEPTLGVATFTLQAAASLQNSTSTSGVSTDTSPALGGDWGQTAASHLVISGVGNQPDGTLENDFVELHNPTATPITINGHTIWRDAGCSLGSWTGSLSLPNVSIPAGGYYLIARTSNTYSADATGSFAIGTDYCFALTNDGTAPSAWNDANVVDFIAFEWTGNPDQGEGGSNYEPDGGISSGNAARRKGSCRNTDTDSNIDDWEPWPATVTPNNSASPICTNDTTPPTLDSVTLVDAPNAGAANGDTIDFVFNEDVDPASISSALVGSNTNNSLAVGSGDITGSLADIIGELGSFATTTNVTSTAATLTMPNNTTVRITLAGTTTDNTTFPGGVFTMAASALQDSAGNDINTATTQTATGSWDATSPTVTGNIETADLDQNGKIDAIKVTFSENVDDSAIDPSLFSINGYGTGQSISTAPAGDNVDDAVVHVLFNEQAGTCDDTSQAGCDTDATPDIDITVGAVQDFSGNNTPGNTGITSVDRAAPVMVGAVSWVGSDWVKVYFSEAVYTNTGAPACGSGGNLVAGDFEWAAGGAPAGGITGMGNDDCGTAQGGEPGERAAAGMVKFETGSALAAGDLTGADQVRVAANQVYDSLDNDSPQVATTVNLRPYVNTIKIDGDISDFNQNSETFYTTTTQVTYPYPANDEFPARPPVTPDCSANDRNCSWVTYDSSNIYVGMQNADVNSASANQWIVVYLSTNITDTANGTNTGLAIGTQQPDFGNFNYHYLLRIRTSDQFTELVRWNGSSWAAATYNGSVARASGAGSDRVEISIPKSDISGIGTNINVLPMMVDASASGPTDRGLYRYNFSDGDDADPRCYTRKDFTSNLVPNDTSFRFCDAGITVSATALPNTTEAGAGSPQSFTVVLDTKPTADVVLNISSSDTTEGTLNTSTLSFTSANWNVPQTVTVTGVDESIDDGDILYAVQFDSKTTADVDYNALPLPGNVAVTNTDDDTFAVTSATTRDLDSDGRIDAIDLVFSEPISDASVVASQWTFNGNPGTGVASIGAADDNTIRVVYATDDLVVDTSATGASIVFLNGTSVQSLAGSVNLAAIADVTETDGAAPVLISASGNGGSSSVALTFSEPVYTNTGASGALVAGDFAYQNDNAGGGTSITGLSEADGSDNVVTATLDSALVAGDFNTDDIGAATAASIYDAVDNPAANSVLRPITDSTAPTITARETLDNDGDGQIDRIRITFDEPISDASVTSGNFTVAGFAVSGFTSGTANDNEIFITLTESGSPDTDAVPNITYTAGTLTDLSGNNLASNGPTAATDTAAPVILSATSTVGSTALTVTVSEPVDTDGGALAANLATGDFGYTDTSGSGAASISSLGDNDGSDESFTITVNTAFVLADFGSDTINAAATQLFDSATNAAATTAVTITNTDTTAPTITARETLDNDGDGQIDRIRITFDEPISDGSVTSGNFTVAGFTVSGFTSGTANDNEIFLTLTESGSPDTDAVPNITYTAGTLTDLSGNNLASNGPTAASDTAAPVILSATSTVGSTTLTVTVSEPVDTDGGALAANLATGDFGYTDTSGSGAASISSLGDSDGSDETFTITVNTAFALADFGSDTINAAATQLFDGATNAAATTAVTITNTDTTAPTITARQTQDNDADGQIDRIRITFDEPISDASVTSGNFTVAGFTVSAFTSGTANDNEIFLTLTGSGSPDTDAVPNITYTEGSLTDLSGNNLASNGPTAATDTAAPVILSATSTVGSTTLTVTVSEPVDTDGGALAANLVTGDFGYTDTSASGAASISSLGDNDGSDETFTITVNTAFVPADFGSDTINAAATQLFDGATNAAATTAVTITNTDSTAPTITARQTQDNDGDGQIDRIRITFDEAISDASVTAGDFAVAGFTVSGFSSGTANDNEIFLTLTESGSPDTNAVPNITYTAGTLTDLSGNNLASNGPTAASDTAAPVILSATSTVGSTTLTVTVSEPVDTDGGSLAANLVTGDFGYTDTSGSGAASISSLGDNDGSDETFTITVNTAFVPADFGSDTINAAATQLFDSATNAAATTAVTITNTDTTAPTITARQTQDNDGDGQIDRIRITFDEAISDASVTSGNFTVAGFTVSGFTSGTANDNEIFLTLTESGSPDTDAVPNITYTAGTLTDLSGNNLASNGPTAASDTAAPVILSATSTVGSTTLTVTVSEPVDTDGGALAANLVTGDFGYTDTSGSGAASISSLGDNDGSDESFTITVNTAFVLADFGSDTINAAATQLFDGATNAAATTAVTITNTDTTAPTITARETQDNDGDGQIDRIRITFDEAISDASVTSGNFTVAGFAVSGFTSGTANDNEIFLTLTESGSPDTNAVPNITYTAGTLTDLSGNNLASNGPTAASDTAAPVILSATSTVGSTTLTVTVSEPVDTDGGALAANLVTGDFGYTDTSGSGAASISSMGDNDGSDETFIITVNTAFVLADFGSDTINAAATQLFDGATNAAATTAVTITNTDTTAPTITARQTQDNDGDGQIDRIRITFDEAISDASVTSGNFTVAGFTVSGFTSGTANDNEIFLTLTESGSPDTDAVPNITYTAGTLTDLSGNNLASNGPTAASDTAAPVILSATSTVGSTTLTVTVSEPVDTDGGALAANLVTGDFGYTDTSGSGAASISALGDNDGSDESFTITVNTAFVLADFGSDTINAAATQLFDSATNAAVTTAVTITNTDSTPPTITARQTQDNDGDGQIDRIRIAFDEAISDASVTSGNFTVAGFTVSGFTSGTANDNEIFLTLTESGSPDTDAVPNITYTAGTLTDLSGNSLASNGPTAASDTAAPVILSATSTVGSTTLTVTVSEPVDTDGGALAANLVTGDLGYTNTSGSGAASITGMVDNDGSDESFSVTVNAAFILADGGSDTINASAAQLFDTAGNSAATTAVTVSITDTTPPTITARETVDSDGDGQVDQIRIVFDEPISDASVTAGDFTITGYSVSGFTSGTANDNEIFITLTESGTADTDATPNVTYTAGTLTDASGNNLATNGPIAAVDAAAPVVLSATSTPGSTTITVTMSEPVDTDGAPLAANLAAGDLNYTDNSGAGASSILALPDNDGTDSVFTITVDAAFESSDFNSDTINLVATQVSDAAGNNAPAITIAITDPTASTTSSSEVTDLTNTLLGPNPLNTSEYPDLYFDQVPDQTQVVIFSSIGKKVADFIISSATGKYRWPLTSGDGANLPGGIYIVKMQSPSGETKMFRLVIRRY